MLGQLPVVVSHGEKQYELNVLVVDGDGSDPLGRDWMDVLKVTFSVGEESLLQEIHAKHSSLFTAELGCLKGMEVKLNVNPNATPKFFKAHTVPLALKEKVD